MKAISLWQPWATLIALNEKLIETRGRLTYYRGPLAIHAAKKNSNQLGHMTWLTEPFATVLHRHGVDMLPRGFVVATCELVDCVPIEPLSTGWTRDGQTWTLTGQERQFGDYTPGRFALLLGNIKQLAQPVPAVGAQWLFEVTL